MESYKELIVKYPKNKVDEFIKWYFNNIDKSSYKSESFSFDRKSVRLLKKFCNTNIPIQQIVGYSMFHGNKFFINKNVLIPRSETEILVDIFLNQVSAGNVLEIGTGSGCVSSSIYLENKKLSIDATDISNKAIKVAKRNIKSLEVKLNVIKSDLFKNVDIKKYDYIISNPPYIAYDDDIDNSVLNNEPHLALFADDGGLFFYKKIIQKSLENKNIKKCFFEIGSNQKGSLENYINSIDIHSYKFFKDYSGNYRVLVLTFN
ncbi:MAG: peptide chain release factor N(5)-glutamine methyltransferase [Mycoplasmataceae bacterium]|nr:peptide chain release factor N(5)-glutamine methyltransferase [Mycoplasmataceae bacterium]